MVICVMKLSMKCLGTVCRAQFWLTQATRALSYWFHWITWWDSKTFGTANIIFLVRMWLLCCTSLVDTLNWEVFSSLPQQIIIWGIFMNLDLWFIWNWTATTAWLEFKNCNLPPLSLYSFWLLSSDNITIKKSFGTTCRLIIIIIKFISIACIKTNSSSKYALHIIKGQPLGEVHKYHKK